jgi:hypothetical protein
MAEIIMHGGGSLAVLFILTLVAIAILPKDSQ